MIHLKKTKNKKKKRTIA